MGPKKNRKQDDEEMWSKNQKNLQEILKKVKHSKNSKKNAYDNLDEQEEIVNSKKKQVFDWDLSEQNMKALQKSEEKKQKQQRQKQLQQQEAKKLSPAEQKQLERKLQKQKIQKDKKDKKKEQKKAERQKELEQQKIDQQKKKQEEEKQNQEVEKKVKKPATNGKFIPIFFIVFIATMCVLQYQRQIYVRLSKFKLDQEENFYDIFEIDSGVTDRQLKEKYKRLVLKYHPDKNPACGQCEEKFNRIIKAWQVLGSPEKRRHYDANAGFVTQIKSQSITLTPSKYEQLVEGSNSLWMIQVFDSTQKYCHYFAQFWEDMVQQYGGFVKFGRVDVWTQTDMLSYLPYKFQVFPTIYFYHKGEIGLCTFDFQKPDSSVRRCLQSQYKESNIQQITKLEEIKIDAKPSIVFTEKVKIGTIFKILSKKYEQSFNFYQLKEKNEKQQIFAILPNNETKVFALNSRQQEYYQKYQKFLESLMVQKVSICELISTCENQPCFILLSDNKGQSSIQNYVLPKQDPDSCKPVFVIEEKEFYHALEDLKNKTSMRENFNLGLYQNGHIDLGYIQDALILNPEEGENFQQLHCVYKDRSWIGKIKSLAEKLFNLF